MKFNWLLKCICFERDVWYSIFDNAALFYKMHHKEIITIDKNLDEHASYKMCYGNA